jgi:crossover junction endodeoxyribonuclease RuvC
MGIDPGLNRTGYGVIEADGRRYAVVAAGDIRPPAAGTLAHRLDALHRALTGLLTQHRPEVVVLEMLYTHQQHITTAAILAHARGMACLAAEQHGIPLIEYPPNRVKQSITGHGTATKEQVARMVAQWLGQRDASWSFDATDALALAIAHAQMDSAMVGISAR